MWFSLTPHSWQAALDRNGQALLSPCLTDDWSREAASVCGQDCHLHRAEEGPFMLLRLCYTRLHWRTGHHFFLPIEKNDYQEQQEKLEHPACLEARWFWTSVQHRGSVKVVPWAEPSVTAFAADLKAGAVRSSCVHAEGSLSFRRDCSLGVQWAHCRFLGFT